MKRTAARVVFEEQRALATRAVERVPMQVRKQVGGARAAGKQRHQRWGGSILRHPLLQAEGADCTRLRNEAPNLRAQRLSNATECKSFDIGRLREPPRRSPREGHSSRVGV